MSAYSNTICHVAPASGCQKVPVVGLLEGRGGALLVAEPPELDPDRWVRPTPSPMLIATKTVMRKAERTIQQRFAR